VDLQTTLYIYKEDYAPISKEENSGDAYELGRASTSEEALAILTIVRNVFECQYGYPSNHLFKIEGELEGEDLEYDKMVELIQVAINLHGTDTEVRRKKERDEYVRRCNHIPIKVQCYRQSQSTSYEDALQGGAVRTLDLGSTDRQTLQGIVNSLADVADTFDGNWADDLLYWVTGAMYMEDATPSELFDALDGFDANHPMIKVRPRPGLHGKWDPGYEGNPGFVNEHDDEHCDLHEVLALVEELPYDRMKPFAFEPISVADATPVELKPETKERIADILRDLRTGGLLKDIGHKYDYEEGMRFLWQRPDKSIIPVIFQCYLPGDGTYASVYPVGSTNISVEQTPVKIVELQRISPEPATPEEDPMEAHNVQQFDYDKIEQDTLDRVADQYLKELSFAELMSTEGVGTVLREAYNNEILEACKADAEEGLEKLKSRNEQVLEEFCDWVEGGDLLMLDGSEGHVHMSVESVEDGVTLEAQSTTYILTPDRYEEGGKNEYRNLEMILGTDVDGKCCHLVWGEKDLCFRRAFKEESRTVLGLPIQGKIFVFAGFRSPALEEAITHAGGIVAKTVGKHTCYLVVLGAVGSSKFKKALELGTTILGRDALGAQLGLDLSKPK